MGELEYAQSHPFGDPTPETNVVSHGPVENIAGGQPARRWKHDARGKAYPADLLEKGRTMTTAIAERPATLPKDQLELVRRTVANGATNDELALFLYDCERRGIHPLDKLLHFTKRGGKYTPVTSIDFMRAQAAMSGEMAGSEDPTFTMDGEKLTAATVTVYRMTQGQRFPYTATARWSEYCPDNAQMWRRMPHTMLGKCAEALALRKAFPQQLAGLYSREEMDQADGPSGYVVEAPRPAQASVPASRPAMAGVGGAAQTDQRPTDQVQLPSGTPNSDEGPDHGVDLPPGARRILRVKPGAFGAQGFVLLNAPGEGDELEYPVYNDHLKALAEELCKTGEGVLVGYKQAQSSKKWRIEDLARIPKNYTVEPLTRDDIAF